MKKLLSILLFFPLALFGQEDDPCYSINDYNILTQEANVPVSLDLLLGWNIMGYSCLDEGDALELLSPISDMIIIAKNNAGSVYMPEFGFNGIGNLIPNQGYQIKMIETVLGFEMCTNPIPFHQVEGCTDAPYTNNETHSVTIYPENQEEFESLYFSSFELETCCDYVTIYDGKTSSSPVLQQASNGNSLQGITFYASPLNDTGALTLTFTSDVSITPSGWAGEIGCTTIQGK